MDLDTATLLQFVAALGALVAGAAAVATAAVGLSRPARLRTEEALWRQLHQLDQPQPPDDAEHQDGPAGQLRPDRDLLTLDLHRHAVAEIVSRRLVPGTPVTSSVVGALALGLCVLIGALGAAIVIDGPSRISVGVWIMFVFLLVAGTYSSQLLVVHTAGAVQARRGTARHVLENVYPIPHVVKEGSIARLTSYRAEPVRFVRLKTLGLAVSITVALAAVSAVIFAAWPGTSWGQYVTPWHAFVYTSCAFLGAAAAALLWDELVENAPAFSSSALQSIGERGHEERGVPQRRLPWRLLGLVLGACIGVLVGGLFGGPIGGVVGAAAGYGLGGRRA